MNRRNPIFLVVLMLWAGSLQTSRHAARSQETSASLSERLSLRQRIELLAVNGLRNADRFVDESLRDQSLHAVIQEIQNLRAEVPRQGPRDEREMNAQIRLLKKNLDRPQVAAN